MKSATKNLLNQPVGILELSNEFKTMAQVNHFQTLSQLVELPMDVLQRMAMFNYRVMAEYISFMERNGFGGLIEN